MEKAHRKYYFLTRIDHPQHTPQDVKPRDVLNGLVSFTTAHGIPRTVGARGIVKKSFWGMIMIATVGALIANISYIAISFGGFHVDVSIQLSHENELSFPAVTICNMSPLRKSALANIENLNDLATQARKRRKRSVPLNCPDNWTDYSSWCYYFGNDSLTYSAARNECLALDADLTSVEDLNEHNFVAPLTSLAYNQTYWLGLHNTSGDGFAWVDGTNYTWSKWDVGRPNGSVDCAVLDGNAWRDDDCNATHNYICKKPADIEMTTTTSGWTTDLTSEHSTVETNMYTSPTTERTATDKCCCMCCSEPNFYTGVSNTCSSCSANALSEASVCAASNLPTYTIPPETSEPVTVAPPKPVNGSKFPERIQTTEDFQKKEVFTEILADVPVATKSELGFSAAELIMDCQYAGYQCQSSDFDQFYNAIHGNCFVYNSGWQDNSTVLKAHKAGRRHGLHLLVNIDQDDYIQETGDTAGLRLVVTPQRRMPFPEDEGITVPPGQSTSIGMRQVIVERQAWPYGECLDPETQSTKKNVYADTYPIIYSTNACFKTCFQRHVINRCGCADPYYPMTGKAFGNVSVDACSSNDMEQDDCKYLVTGEFNNNELYCDCPSSCRDVTYSLEVSTGQWPSKVVKEEIWTKYAPKIGYILNDPSDPDKYKDNLMKIEIFYEEFNFEIISERPAYAPENFLSDIGGVLGLWLGMSVLTLFEFIEVGMDFVAMACMRASKTGSRISSLAMHPNLRGIESEELDTATPRNVGVDMKPDKKTFLGTNVPPPPYFTLRSSSRPLNSPDPPPYSSRKNSSFGVSNKNIVMSQ